MSNSRLTISGTQGSALPQPSGSRPPMPASAFASVDSSCHCGSAANSLAILRVSRAFPTSVSSCGSCASPKKYRMLAALPFIALSRSVSAIPVLCFCIDSLAALFSFVAPWRPAFFALPGPRRLPATASSLSCHAPLPTIPGPTPSHVNKPARREEKRAIAVRDHPGVFHVSISETTRLAVRLRDESPTGTLLNGLKTEVVTHSSFQLRIDWGRALVRSEVVSDPTILSFPVPSNSNSILMRTHI